MSCYRCHTFYEDPVPTCEVCSSKAFYSGTPLMEFEEVAFPLTFGGSRRGYYVESFFHFDRSTQRPARGSGHRRHAR